MPTTPLLQRFVDDELTRAEALIERTLAGTLQRLAEGRAPAVAGPAPAHRAPLLDATRRQAGAFRIAFLSALRAEVQQQLHSHRAVPLPGAGEALPPPSRARPWELLDESRVDVDIEISRATQAMATAAEWEVKELQTFTSTLLGHDHVRPDSNPLQPLVYAAALWRATAAVTGEQAQRVALLQAAAAVMAGLLKTAWAAACTRLENQGVEPGVYRTLVLMPGALGARDTAAPPASGLRALLGKPPAHEPAGPRPGLVPGGAARSDTRAPTGPRSATSAGGADGHRGPAFEQALHRLENTLREPPPEPAGGRDDAGSRIRRVNEHRSALIASAGSAADRQLVELLSRLFETLLADPTLSPPFRPVLARLQVAALRVALDDPAMMDSDAHPVWELLDRIGDVSTGVSLAGNAGLGGLLGFCRTLAEDLARDATPDAALFSSGLARLDAFLAEQLKRQREQAEELIATLVRTEQRDVLEQQLQERLGDDLAGVPTSASLRRFIVGPWATVLAEAMLRHGNDAEETRAYFKAADDLIWSLKLPDHPQSRQRLVTLLPGLLDRLRAGLASTAIAEAEQAAFFDELMAVHTESLRLGPRPPGTLAHDAVGGSRAATTRRSGPALPADEPFAGSDPVIDIPSLPTVPAELMLDERPRLSDATGPVDKMTEGQRYRLFLQGRWIKTQLLWRSPLGRMLLLAGDAPDRPHAITRRALARLNEAGLAELDGMRSMVQRAVDSLLRRASGTV